MSGKVQKHCKICGNEYEMCVSCEKNHSWKVHTDTADHYYIFTVLMAYQVDHDAKQAYRVLRKRGIDFRDTAEFKPHIQEIMAEIYALAHENSRAKNTSVIAESINAEYVADNKTAEQHE